MKAFLTRLFWFILRRFEKGEGSYAYKPSNRTILLIVGGLFCGLSGASLYFSLQQNDVTAILPVLVFFVVGGVCLVVGLLGSDRAVASLWGNTDESHRRK